MCVSESDSMINNQWHVKKKKKKAGFVCARKPVLSPATAFGTCGCSILRFHIIRRYFSDVFMRHCRPSGNQMSASNEPESCSQYILSDEIVFCRRPAIS